MGAEGSTQPLVIRAGATPHRPPPTGATRIVAQRQSCDVSSPRTRCAHWLGAWCTVAAATVAPAVRWPGVVEGWCSTSGPWHHVVDCVRQWVCDW